MDRLTNFATTRSLQLAFSDYEQLTQDEDSYVVVEDLTEWLANTRCLSISGGFTIRAENHQGPGGRTVGRNERIWSLLRRITTNFGCLEHLYISRELWGLYLPPILQSVNCPKLKLLNVHGISEWKDGPVELGIEVRNLPSTTLS